MEVTPERLILEDTVRLQLQADVLVGALLSGGGGSAIVALMQKHSKSQLEPMRLGLTLRMKTCAEPVLWQLIWVQSTPNFSRSKRTVANIQQIIGQLW